MGIPSTGSPKFPNSTTMRWNHFFLGIAESQTLPRWESWEIQPIHPIDFTPPPYNTDARTSGFNLKFYKAWLNNGISTTNPQLVMIIAGFLVTIKSIKILTHKNPVYLHVFTYSYSWFPVSYQLVSAGFLVAINRVASSNHQASSGSIAAGELGITCGTPCMKTSLSSGVKAKTSPLRWGKDLGSKNPVVLMCFTWWRLVTFGMGG